jgi:signal transduction histidine kinase
MERRLGMGLRAQILLGLSAAFLVSFTALGLVVVSLTKRAQEVERRHRNQAMAEALAVSFSDRRVSSETLASLVGRAEIKGIALRSSQGVGMRFGGVDSKPDAVSTLKNGDVLALWTEPIDADATTPMAGLLRLYLIVTGLFVLLIAYVALTRLIVRPVEALTRASERLARGLFATKAPVAGASEVASLAVSFNRMAKELEDDRSLLEARFIALKRASEELEAAQEKLIRSEKLASVGRLGAGIAHEIGNPLSAILGFVELLQMGGLSSGEQEEFLRRVRSETERIHRIIRDLLDFSRAKPLDEAGDANADLAEVVEDAVKLVTPQKDLRGVTIERRFEGDVPRVRGAAHALTQVILNLLLNAADAISGEGSVLIEVQTMGEFVELRVSDSGPGISEAMQDKLFDPFVTSKPPGKGTGLGLAVCLSLVEELGGTVTARNGERGGACFIVRLPRAVG